MPLMWWAIQPGNWIGWTWFIYWYRIKLTKTELLQFFKEHLLFTGCTQSNPQNTTS